MSKTSKTSKKTATTKKKTTSSKKSAAKPKTKASDKKTAKKEQSKKKSSPKKPAAKKKAPAKKTPSKMDKEMLSELEKEISSQDEQVCLGAVERLGILNHPDATRVLIIALADPRYMVRIHAAAQLGERKDKKAVDALVNTLNDDSIFVRQTAAGALENIGSAKAKKAISKAEREGLLLDELPEGKRLDK
ncbi:MAG: HEAT repeat domain-containing protein [Candidatus Thorarchaeota archaeon]